MAGKRAALKIEPIVLIRDEGADPEEWEKVLDVMREIAQEESRTLVIVERPRHTEDEQERVDRKIAAAAKQLINEYIEKMDRRIADGEVTPAERKKYEQWKVKYIQEEAENDKSDL